MTTTPVRVQVPGLNLQQEIGSSIRYTSATCLTHSIATPSQYYLIKQRYNFIKITVIEQDSSEEKRTRNKHGEIRKSAFTNREGVRVNHLLYSVIDSLHDPHTQHYTETALTAPTSRLNHYIVLPLWPVIDGPLSPLPSGQSGKVH
ncbi:hypothetical protein OUZ56_027916 [Daphnia magna]|uniref:Uncharacterized protein n=1 Tax=Daphnia magna TaxID=35525 RepID=A0ABR0B2I6_9CRUS|nr:hypothetical protein OUZ56_027916 [Daphnia magna]